MPRTATAKANGQEKLAQAGRIAAKARWEAVREDREQFIEPFNSLPIEKALSYLEDLRKICEEGGNVINDRITGAKNITCSGPGCKHDLSGTRPDGRPKWIGQIPVADPRNPIGRDGKPHLTMHYFCSELCWNGFMRKHDGSMGSEAKK